MKKNRVWILSALLVAGLSLTACGGAKQTDTKGTESSGNPEAAAAGKEGESSLALCIGPSPETIDPALNSTLDGGSMILHLTEGLTRFDQEANIVPGAAESWDISEDGLTWTFHIRKGLKWSDGSDLNAHDFEYSWKRVADPDTAAPYAGDILGYLSGYEEASQGDLDKLGVKAVDDDTLEVKLVGPCTYFDKLAGFPTLVPVNQKAIEANPESWTQSPDSYISNGAYKLSEYTDGDRIVMAKNENYWDKDNVTMDTLTFHLMEDPNTCYTAYNDGSLDLTNQVPTEEYQALADNPEFHKEPTIGTSYVIFNCTRAPFDNPKVRYALSLAIDRKYIAETMMLNTVEPATTIVGPGVSDVEAGSSFMEVSRETYEKLYDVDDYEAQLQKAKEVLAEAGYPEGNGFPSFEYLNNIGGYNMTIAEYLQSCWKQLGITMNINNQEWKTMSADRRSGNFDVARGSWILDWDDPSNILNLFVIGSGNNNGKYENPEYDALIQKSKKALTTEEHMSALHEAEQLILKDVPIAPFTHSSEKWLQKSDLSDVVHSSYGYFLFMHAKKG